MRHRTKPGTETAPATGKTVMPCLVIGEPRSPVELHPKIKGIPPLSDTKGGVQLTLGQRAGVRVLRLGQDRLRAGVPGGGRRL